MRNNTPAIGIQCEEKENVRILLNNCKIKHFIVKNSERTVAITTMEIIQLSLSFLKCVCVLDGCCLQEKTLKIGNGNKHLINQ